MRHFLTRPASPPRRRPALGRRAPLIAPFAAVLLAATALSGCTADTAPIERVETTLLGVPDLPESPEVENALWPRLVDNPAMLEEAERRPLMESARALDEAVNEDVEALLAEAEAMERRPSSMSEMEREAEALRSAGDALQQSDDF